MYQCGCHTSAPSLTLDVMYTVRLAASYTGVDVTPMVGARSPQPTVDTGQAGPSDVRQLTAPDVGSSPYAWLASVATTTVPPAVTGWA